MIEYREIHAKDLYFIDEYEPDSFRQENAITCCNLDLTQIDMTFLVYTAPKDYCFFMFDKYSNLYTQESVWTRSLTSAEKRVINKHFKLAGITPKRIPFETGGSQFCLYLFVPNRCVSEVKKYFEDQVRLAGSDIIIPSQQYDGFSKHPTVLQVDRFLSNIKALQIFLLNCKQDRSLLLEHPIIARLDCRLQIWGVLRKNLSYSREFSYSNLNIQGDVPASNQYNIEGKAYVAALIRLLGWYAFYDLAKLYIELIEEANTDFIAPQHDDDPSLGDYSYREELTMYIDEMERKYSFLTQTFS